LFGKHYLRSEPGNVILRGERWKFCLILGCGTGGEGGKLFGVFYTRGGDLLGMKSRKESIRDWESHDHNILKKDAESGADFIGRETTKGERASL